MQHTSFKRTKGLSFFWLLAATTCSLWVTTDAQAAPSTMPTRVWKNDVATSCKVKPDSIKKVKHYTLNKAGEIVGFALAHIQTSSKLRPTALVWLPYQRCKSGWCPQQCITLQTESCAGSSKSGCFFQFRASQLIDLQAPSTDVSPESGSWWGTKLQEPKQQAKWPLLLIQGQVIRGSGNKQRSETKTTLLSLRQATQPRPLKTLVTRKQWPVVLIAGRKQDPIGKRIRLIQFRHPAFQPIRMTTIQRPIPSPFDRCCKPKDTYQTFELSSKGFARVFAL